LEEEEKEKQEERRRRSLGFNEENPWCQEKEDELIREDQELQLFTACETGNKYIVKRLLLCNNLNLNCVGGSTGGSGMEQKKTKTPGATPLFKACQKNHIEVVTMLLLQSDRVDVNQATDEGMTPLYIACDKNRTEIVRLLLDTNRVEVNQATEKHTTPLCIASWAGNLEIVRLLLLQPNIDIDVQDDFGDTAMSAAKGKGHQEVVALLQVHARKMEATT
jgi:ankyrin repeat protein